MVGMNPMDPTANSVVGQAEQVQQALTQHLLTYVNKQGGWLPFEQFMALALYTPGLGYYSSGRQVIGQGPQDGSDFVTAPEMSPLFGQVLAKQVHEALQATQTREVWEFGAGRGTLAVQLLQALEALHSGVERYTIVELSGSLRAAQQQAIQQAAPHLAHKVQWVSSWPDSMQGVVVGNEVLDAMPVQLLVWDGAQWLERGVVSASDGAWAWSDRAPVQALRPPTDHEDSAYAPGTVVEVHRHADAFMASLSDRLSAGAVFLMDYGFPANEFYLPQRTGGTLMCHHQHRSDDNPLQLVGQKDITAHVNFTSIALAGQDAGLEVLGYTSQARFLINLGIAPLMAAAVPGEPTLDEIRLVASTQRLIAEHEMGELFKVIGFVKGEWFDAQGFATGDRSHTL